MSMPRLFRVILPVADIDPASAFYAELLGQPGMRVSGGRHYFPCGDVMLALYSPKGDGDPREPRPNWDHVYFAVDDIDAVYQRAKKRGGFPSHVCDCRLPLGETATRPWGERSFYLSDPFGNPLCFVDSMTLFTGRPT